MTDESEDDVRAISTIISALKPLDHDTRVHVLEFVFRRLGISLSPSTSQEKPLPLSTLNTPNLGPSPLTPSASASSDEIDIRSFAAQKNPKTVNERVAVVAYYLAHLAPAEERRDYIASEDIQPYFIQANFHLPTAPPNMTLTHAKNAGYLNAIERGRYKLNAVGYNLVGHKLPTGETTAPKRSTPSKTPKRKTRRNK